MKRILIILTLVLSVLAIGQAIAFGNSDKEPKSGKDTVTEPGV